MKKLFVLLCFVVASAPAALAHEPDAVYLFSYATEKNGGRNGLHFAWSPDKQHWFGIGYLLQA